MKQFNILFFALLLLGNISIGTQFTSAQSTQEESVPEHLFFENPALQVAYQDFFQVVNQAELADPESLANNESASTTAELSQDYVFAVDPVVTENVEDQTETWNYTYQHSDEMTAEEREALLALTFTEDVLTFVAVTSDTAHVPDEFALSQENVKTMTTNNQNQLNELEATVMAASAMNIGGEHYIQYIVPGTDAEGQTFNYFLIYHNNELVDYSQLPATEQEAEDLTNEMVTNFLDFRTELETAA